MYDLVTTNTTRIQMKNPVRPSAHSPKNYYPYILGEQGEALRGQDRKEKRQYLTFVQALTTNEEQRITALAITLCSLNYLYTISTNASISRGTFFAPKTTRCPLAALCINLMLFDADAVNE